MKIYICVDDTDDLTKSTSTGKIADLTRPGNCGYGREDGTGNHAPPAAAPR